MKPLIKFSQFIDSELRHIFSEETWDHIETSLHQNPSAKTLISHSEIFHTGQTQSLLLLTILAQFRNFLDWNAKTKASSLAKEVLLQTKQPQEIQFLEHAVSHFGTDAHLQDLLSVYKTSVSKLYKEGEIRAYTDEKTYKTDEQALELTGAFRPSEISGQKWLAWRRYQRKEKLGIQVHFPKDMLPKEIALRFQEPVQPVKDFLDAKLSKAIFYSLDQKAQNEAFQEAARTYQGLLEAPALQVAQVVAIFVGAPKQALGACLVSKEGKVLSKIRIEMHADWLSQLQNWLQAHPAKGYVLPTTALDKKRLYQVRSALPKASIGIKPAGLSSARKVLDQEGTHFAKEIASAFLLARRAQVPLKEWGKIDPILLGLAEYQHDLNATLLRKYLQDVYQIVLYHKQSTQKPELSSAPAQEKLNPLLRSLTDIRPGMALAVEVSSLASFGAFVTFGLETEGLIHISQLAKHRIASPSEVVRIGQRLRAYVVEVDLKRNRISLSLISPKNTRQTHGKADALLQLKKVFKS